MSRTKQKFAVVATALAATAAAAPLPGGTLSPVGVPKYTEQLVIPPTFAAATTTTPAGVAAEAFDLSVRPTTQQVLPTVNAAGAPLATPYPKTPVWGYGSATQAPYWPAFTIEARQGTPTFVTWRNQLVDGAGNFVPHLFTIDQTLHWANPPKANCADMTSPSIIDPVNPNRTECRTIDAKPYAGPVPIVTHLHGGHIEAVSDGFPEAWYLPSATNIPAGYATQGSRYGTTGNAAAPGPGAATAYYQNDQRATTLWYHDHTLGMTRANVYAGLAGFYLLRDAYEVNTLKLTAQYPYGTYEIPLAIQDRSFNVDGTLFYPTTRVFFDGFAGPYLPSAGTDISPYWNPEFFGNFMVVNGKTWPKQAVEARRYRFRLLNGCDSRWLILSFADVKLKALPIAFNVIGTDGGFLTGAPVATQQLVMAPGERYDVIVDFAGVAPGTRVILTNSGPDMPYGGGKVTGAAAADPGTTGQIMAFDVKAAVTANPPLPASLQPPLEPFMPAPIASLATAKIRTVTLTEFPSVVNPAGPSEAQVGDAFGPKPWMAKTTENVAQNTAEVWQIVNRTVDAHPIHLHQTQFQILDRTPLNLAGYDAQIAKCQATPTAIGCPADPFAFVKKNTAPAVPAAYEAGQKDTVMARPGEITRVKAYFDIPGLYVWHCHILSHEDNEMMRPLCVEAPGVATGCGFGM